MQFQLHHFDDSTNECILTLQIILIIIILGEQKRYKFFFFKIKKNDNKLKTIRPLVDQNGNLHKMGRRIWQIHSSMVDKTRQTDPLTFIGMQILNSTAFAFTFDTFWIRILIMNPIPKIARQIVLSLSLNVQKHHQVKEICSQLFCIIVHYEFIHMYNKARDTHTHIRTQPNTNHNALLHGSIMFRTHSI